MVWGISDGIHDLIEKISDYNMIMEDLLEGDKNNG